MNKDKSSVVGKIKQNLFMATDVVSMELVVEKLTPRKMEGLSFLEQCAEGIEDVEGILTQGSTWEFNPTNQLLFASGSTDFVIDRKKLNAYIEEKASFEVKELDVNNNVTIMKVPVEILLENVRMMSDEMIKKSSYHVVSTLFGKIEL